MNKPAPVFQPRPQAWFNALALATVLWVVLIAVGVLMWRDHSHVHRSLHAQSEAQASVSRP